LTRPSTIYLAAIVIIIIVAALSFGIFFEKSAIQTVSQSSSTQTSSVDGILQTESRRTARIVLSDVTLTVEIAETQPEWTQGLSGRNSMASDQGMLFIFDHEAKWSFWMKDVKFPLDIIWFNSNRQVVYVEHDLSPCSSQNCPVFTPPSNARYVLEVNAGFAATHNISIGDTFIFLD
jgi:uncharacterized membrane protein (UPF0127 family)